jgi:multifunctional 2-oxoglutarate metabolism enzyme
MSQATKEISVNSWLEEELLREYQSDQRGVDASWAGVFRDIESVAPPAAAVPPAPLTAKAPSATSAPAPSSVPAPSSLPAASSVPAAPAAVTATGTEQMVPLKGAAARIAENMNVSLSVPTATSMRVIPVKVIDENRTLVNQHLALSGRGKVSYTHLVAWAIVRAVEAHPSINHAFAEKDGVSYRILRDEINIGIAVDVTAKDGSRGLMVPSIKNAGAMNFSQFLKAFDDIVSRARVNKPISRAPAFR